MRLRVPLVLLALLAVLIGGAALPGTATAADPTAGAPAAGECYDVGYDDVAGASLKADSVACTARHTMTIVGLGQLPAKLDWDSPDTKLAAASERICAPAWEDAIGADQTLGHRSQYMPLWFEPTKAQQGAGARWVSCGIALISGTRLLPLPAVLTPVTTNPDDSIARCGTASYVFVVCAKKHAYRLTDTFVIRARGDYDALDAAGTRAAARRCPDLVASPRDWMYSWTSVSATKVVVGCLTKTTK